MQIPDTFRDDCCFAGIYKNLHQRAGKDPDRCGDDDAEQYGYPDGGPDACLYPLWTFRSVVLGDKQGEGIAEFLYRHISQGIDLYCSGKGCHDSGAETVDQSLDHQDAEVHNRLLQTGEKGIAAYLRKGFPAKMRCSFDGNSCGFFRRAAILIPIPATACAMTVAPAAPPTPR